jgi:outer membrane protein TolC
VRAASAAQRRAQAELDNQERALAVSQVSADGALQAALAGLEARQQALVAAEEAWSQVDERYRAGLSPIADWLAARRGLQNARVGRARAQAAVGVAVAELEAARGVAD